VSDGAASLELREQLSRLQALLGLSMRMTDSDDEDVILHLAATAVPSVSHCRLVGAHLGEGRWREGRPEVDAAVAADLETQFAVLGSAGGGIGVLHEAWGWAYPLRSLEGHFGYLVVSAGAEPTPAEQLVLRVLAQQTGVALANARLLARERTRATELRAANATLAEAVAALERSTAIHDRLTRVAAAGEGQEGIARAVNELTGFAVAVEDRHGNLRAWAGSGRPKVYPKPSRDRREALLERAFAAEGPIFDNGRLLAVARPGHDVIGVLALIDPDGDAGDPAKAALEQGAMVLAMELTRLWGIAQAELRLGRDLADDLLEGTDEEIAIARAEALGYDLERPHRVVVVEGGRTIADRDAFFDAVRRAARDFGVGTLLTARRASVIVLSDTDRPWEGFRAVVMRELRGASCRIGVGSTCAGVADFPRSYHEAQLTARLQATSGGGDRATAFDDLGVYRLFLGVDDVEGIERFVHEWLGGLLDYDAGKEGSELVVTLGHYLDYGKSYEATAQALSVHRSTLKYRLQRIREISGHDLASPDILFNLQLASRAWRTLQAIRADTP